MSFIAPLFFVALAGLAIPVLIHLIQREKKQILRFPSLMFVQRVPYKSVQRRRIHNWLLLLVRLTALALIVFAFARPFFQRQQTITPGVGAREVVVLLDQSYSIGYGDRWERARSAAYDAINGLGPTDRGTVVHAMLAAVWAALGTRQVLEAAAPSELTVLLEKCAEEALGSLRRYRAEKLAGRFEALERARLVALARDWLAAESRRPDFEVVAIEEKRALTFGGVTVNAKLDRMDRLAAGGHAIIDYKTGQCATSAWIPVPALAPVLR